MGPCAVGCPHCQPPRSITPTLLTLVCLLTTGAAQDSLFARPEPSLKAASTKPARLELDAGEKPDSLAVSPLGPEVALAVRAADGSSRRVLWLGCTEVGPVEMAGAAVKLAASSGNSVESREPWAWPPS